MGSRAVALVCRDLEAATARFGAPGGSTGAVWTRTGRPFFTAGPHRGTAGPAASRGRGRRLVRRAGHRLAAVRRRAAAVERQGRRTASGRSTRRSARRPGTCCRPRSARSSRRPRPAWTLPTARPDQVAGCQRRGVPSRLPPVLLADSGLAGIRFAPFQLLASEGAAHVGRPHDWHLDLADRLVRGRPRADRPDRPGLGGPRRPGDRRRPATAGGKLTPSRRRGHGGQAGRQPGPGQARPGSARSQGARARVPAHHLRPRLHRAGQPAAAAHSAASATSDRWPSGSTRSGSKAWTGWRGASRCGACTNACSRYSRSSRSRSTPGCSRGNPRRYVLPGQSAVFSKRTPRSTSR